jgi:archaellum biogenesis ATPase FlaH
MNIWQPSPPVPVIPKQERPTPAPAPVGPPPDLARIRLALDAIPNTNGRELDYDRWRDVVFALHYATGGSADGLALAHHFSAKSIKYDAAFLEQRVWPYITSDRGGAVITDRKLFAVAAEHGWVDPDVLAGFEIIAERQREAPDASRFAFKPAHEFSAGRPPAWIIKGVIPQADLVVLYGASGAGKSFLALDMAGAVARGVPWRDLRTSAHRVAYIAAEGAGGFRNRLKAYAHQHNLDLSQLDMDILADAPNFANKKDITDLICALQATGRYGLVIVDTLAQVTAGSNENSGEDMGLVVAHCRTIHKVTGATVLLVHHSGKDDSKGARGWSGLRAAADAEIEVSRSDNDRMAKLTKAKDGQDGQGFAFKLLTVPVGLDEDDEIVTSCTVAHGGSAAKAMRLRPMGELELRIFTAVGDAVGLAGEGPTDHELDTEVQARETAEGRAWRRGNYLRARQKLVEGARLQFVDGRWRLGGV